MIPPPASPGKGFGATLAAITLLAVLLRAAALAGQPPLADDFGSALSSVNYVERGQIGPTMWHHPRLRDLAIYPSLSWLGPTKLGLALPSLLLGVAAVPLLGLLGRRLVGARAGLLAALLLTLDSLAIAYSRQAVQEIYPAAFATAAVLAAVEHDARRRSGWLVVSGLIFGIGAASKWSAVFGLPVVLAWLAWPPAAPAPAPRRRAAYLAFLLGALVAVPAAAYAATWVPWLAHGRGLLDLVRLHVGMATEAATHGGYNAATLEAPHRAALWFLVPGSYADAAVGQAGPVRYLAVTSPVVWLLVLPAVAAALERARRGDRARGLVGLLVLASWLPFAVTSRPIWIHSALAVAPFALLAVADLVVRAAEAAGRHARTVLVGYVLTAALVAAPLWLLATGLGAEVGPLRGAIERFRPSAVPHAAGPP